MLQSALSHTRSDLKFTEITVDLSCNDMIVTKRVETAGQSGLIEVHRTVVHVFLNKKIRFYAQNLDLERMHSAPAVVKRCNCL
jgi:hypothetical protein